jgi:SNF2 family DNA or RNA helicase
LKLKEEDFFKDAKALIVVPTTLLTNWRREVEKFSPSLNVHIYHGYKRELRETNVDAIITTYGIIRNEIKEFEKYYWACIVIDEAQNIKNADSVQARSVKNLNGRIKMAISGTPVENRLMEYWSIFDFVNKGYLGNQNYFKKHFAMPIEREREKIKLDKFKNITSPFVLRRLKTDKSIIKDLPEKIEIDDFCYLSQEQASLYQNIVDEAMREIKKRKGIERKGLVFKLMTSLKQICNHPVHFLKKGDVVPESSGKVMLLLDILDDILQSGEKVLIFTQYREMGVILQAIMRERLKIESQFIHGGVVRHKRDRIVDNFQKEAFHKVMLLSLKAAGTGLNLTAATNVIHFDLWWNPAVESQATDRAYRIGQKKNVLIHRFITQGTFEEKIDFMLKSKKDLALESLNQGEKWIGEMSDKELTDMFKL